MKYNIFEELSKDDKELIHSSFIASTIKKHPHILNELFNITIPSNVAIRTETEVHWEKGSRIDIEIILGDQKIIVENKFKCFPERDQLDKYDNFILKKKQELSQRKRKPKVLDDKLKEVIGKFVLCFDKSIDYNLPVDWIVIDYNLIFKVFINLLETNQITNSREIDATIQYLEFLENYIATYTKLTSNNEYLYELFSSNCQDEQLCKNINFWKKLILYRIKAKINQSKYSNILSPVLSDGGTYGALMDIHITNNPKWKKTNSLYFIQCQYDYIQLHCRHDNFNVA
jgi:hypothetical protein